MSRRTRYLPFAGDSFDMSFAYSVLQHFKKPKARIAFKELARVTRPGGRVTVQMANRHGVRSFYHQLRLGFKEGREGHDVIYWTPAELRRTFGQLVGPTDISVDCYFGLNMQLSDADMLPFQHRLIIRSSELLRGLSKKINALSMVADSLYVDATVEPARRDA